jgi:hypothetical protein
MKRLTLLLLVFILTIFIVLYLLYFRNERANIRAEEANFQKQVGTYTLDLRRTDLGSYSRDSNKYRLLTITFNSDSTFVMNMRVPFIFDSMGKWNAAGGGLEDWNWLYFKSWGYEKYEKNRGNQFSQPWTTDSVFYLNGASPRSGEYGVQEIYFKKIRR